jgi:hypothetical protein
MNPKEIRAAIDDFIDLLENGKDDTQANLHALELDLDRLALAYHFADVESEGYDSDAPSFGYKHLRQLATARFPGFGYYNEPKDILVKIGEAELLSADALDDIADIANDLYEVRWHWENTSEKAALWQFCFGYRYHWGAHLRGLQSYLYALIYK